MYNIKVRENTKRKRERERKRTSVLGLFGSYFLKLFYVFKNKENKENKENMFGSPFFLS